LRTEISKRCLRPPPLREVLCVLPSPHWLGREGRREGGPLTGEPLAGRSQIRRGTGAGGQADPRLGGGRPDGPSGKAFCRGVWGRPAMSQRPAVRRKPCARRRNGMLKAGFAQQLWCFAGSQKAQPYRDAREGKVFHFLIWLKIRGKNEMSGALR